MLVMQASTKGGEVLFAVICDGMGGLQKGEVASAAMIEAMAAWLRNTLPNMIEKGFDSARLRSEWKNIIDELSDKISRYGVKSGMRLGTTMVAFLCIGSQYYISNIGDSRIYQIEQNNLYQLTHDHTVVQREIELGHLTPEQAEKDSRRSILLQCIGAGDYVEPDFFTGLLKSGQVFMLCCDGFRHVVSSGEYCRHFGPQVLRDEQGMKTALVNMTEEIKHRKETDNISAILIKTI